METEKYQKEYIELFSAFFASLIILKRRNLQANRNLKIPDFDVKLLTLSPVWANVDVWPF